MQPLVHNQSQPGLTPGMHPNRPRSRTCCGLLPGRFGDIAEAVNMSMSLAPACHVSFLQASELDLVLN